MGSKGVYSLMTLNYVGSNSTSGSNTLRGGCIYEAGNEALILDSDLARLRRYNLTSLTMTSSAVTVASPACVALINSASAVVPSYGSSTVDFIELSSNTRANISGGITSITLGSSYLIAADTSTEIAMYINSTTNVGRVRSNFTASSLAIRTSSTHRAFNCVILKSAGRWLLGTDNGGIYEIDANGNVIGQMSLTIAKTNGLNEIGGIGDNGPGDIYSLYHDNNIIVAGTESGSYFIIDWTSKSVINSQQLPTFGATLPLCNTGSGEAVGINYGLQNPGTSLVQMDLTNKAPRYTSIMYGANAANNAVNHVYTNTQTGRGVYYYVFGPVRFFDVTQSQPTTTRTFTVQSSGIDQRCRLILLDETSGTATGRPILDTIMQSPATYRVPTGRNVIQIIKVGEGATSQWQVSRFTT